MQIDDNYLSKWNSFTIITFFKIKFYILGVDEWAVRALTWVQR